MSSCQRTFKSFLGKLERGHVVFQELAIPTSLYASCEGPMSDHGYYSWTYIPTKREDRSKPETFYWRSKFYIHPIKLSQIKENPKFFCNKLLKDFFKGQVEYSKN